MKKLCFLILLFISIKTFAQNEGAGALISGFNTDIFYQPDERAFNIYTIGGGYKGFNGAYFQSFNIGQLYVPDSITRDMTPIPIQIQFEFDFYHKLTKTTNLWLNYAYSTGPNFPEHRAIGRVWQQLGKGFLASGGLRYYYYDKNLFTITGGLEKYTGRFWVEGETYVYLKDPDARLAYQLNGRYFWKDVNYVQLSLMTGAAQDEPWINTSVLTAHTIRVNVTTYINKLNTLQLRAGVGYSYEEYYTDMWRNRYTGAISLTYYLR